MADKLLPIGRYTMLIYRPVILEDPNNPHHDKHVPFHSTNPFPVPHVGHEIDRAAIFNEHRGSQKRAVVTRVEHGIAEISEGKELWCTVSVYTKEEE